MKRVKFQQHQSMDTHEGRRAQILEQYPEVKKLMIIEERTKYIIGATVILQLACSVLSTWIQDSVAFCLFSYVFGATISHSLFLAIHETTHNSCCKSLSGNQWLGILANLPIVIPYSATFRRYHLFHHHKLGLELDCDIPTNFECFWISYSSLNYVDHCLRKALYLSMYTVVYAVRPLLLHPEIFRADAWFATNVVCQLAFNALLYHLHGMKPFYYLLLSTFLAGSLHPFSGRFLAEHLVVENGFETYSYYGRFNTFFFYKVGAHTEHHDFPGMPWSQLDKLRQIAPEFYCNRPQTPGWLDTTMQFIFDDSIGPANRIIRSHETSEEKVDTGNDLHLAKSSTESVDAHDVRIHERCDKEQRDMCFQRTKSCMEPVDS